jgi:hypothetical protein
VLVVVDPALLVEGFATRGTDAARLLALLEFGAAAHAVDEARLLRSKYLGDYSGDAEAHVRDAQTRWEVHDRRHPAAVMDDWELALSESLLLEVQRMVGSRPSYGLDALHVYKQIMHRYVCRLVDMEDVTRLQAETDHAGRRISRVAQVALACGARWAIVSAAPPLSTRFVRTDPPEPVRSVKSLRIDFDDRQTTLVPLPVFRDQVLPFPLHLVDDRAAV